MSESKQLLTKLVTELAADGPHTVVGIAEQITDQNPGLVDEWFAEQRDLVFHVWISDLLRVQRHSTRRQSSETIAERLAGSSIMDVSEVVNDMNDRKPLGDMVKADLLFVAKRYNEQSKELSLYASVYRALAAKVGNKKVRNAFSEKQILSLYGGEK